MRRKPGSLTPLEVKILQTAIALAAEGRLEFHGFLLAAEIKAREGAVFRTAYGPLYKALDRMEDNGLLASRWEEPAIAESERRPRRCYYRVTAEGQRVLDSAPLASAPDGLDPKGAQA